ncbi:MAG: hypothetical protein ACRC24_00710 [Vibrionaceae bacterium]
MHDWGAKRARFCGVNRLLRAKNGYGTGEVIVLRGALSAARYLRRVAKAKLHSLQSSSQQSPAPITKSA